jgi:undecaprenyl-diphosphatase
MTTIDTVILGIVEGLTEFLPVSSTGHMMVTQALLKIPSTEVSRIFLINIQFGAILSVVFLYWRRFLQSFDFYFKIAVAFIPSAVLGLLLKKHIDHLLSSITTVAVSWIIGGIVLVIADKLFKRQIDDAHNDEDMERVKVINEFGVEVTVSRLKEFKVSWLQAFVIGCFQTVAMIPGVSRSAATIVGGLTQKFNIKRAAEFSFFLGVPTVFAAAVLETFKGIDAIRGLEDVKLLIWGNVISFIVGMVAIRFFIDLISRFGLKFFGYYRIILGVTILILLAMGHPLQIPTK